MGSVGGPRHQAGTAQLNKSPESGRGTQTGRSRHRLQVDRRKDLRGLNRRCEPTNLEACISRAIGRPCKRFATVTRRGPAHAAR